jgi:hypothetical protein
MRGGGVRGGYTWISAEEISTTPDDVSRLYGWRLTSCAANEKRTKKMSYSVSVVAFDVVKSLQRGGGEK